VVVASTHLNLLSSEPVRRITTELTYRGRRTADVGTPPQSSLRRSYPRSTGPARKLPERADRGTSGDVLQPAFSPDTLRDRVAIVTGASQGIGHAIALELAKVGADVVVCSRRRAAVDAVAAEVRAHGRRALGIVCDVGDAAQVDEAVARTLAEFGRVDLLVNNAGYRIRARLEDLPRDEWDAMLRTNLTGVFLFSQAVGRAMIRQQSGKIVNVTSVAGRSGSRGMAAYAAAKAGVTALTQSLGAEWAKYGITVNAVAPGPTETEGVLEVWKTPAMIAQASREVPLQRLARPEEIAWAVIFVASDAANFMTGETLYVSGGPRVANRED
jgi:NAD(P)-dependent dehydrogenase (short-subunit alcohol dehydrogenase family)